jgi:hypothetical protein
MFPPFVDNHPWMIGFNEGYSSKEQTRKRDSLDSNDSLETYGLTLA